MLNFRVILLRMKVWLKQWLEIPMPVTPADLEPLVIVLNGLQKQIDDLRGEVASLKVAQYVPPRTPEPEHKIIKTQTFKQYQAAMEKEFEEREASSAI